MPLRLISVCPSVSSQGLSVGQNISSSFLCMIYFKPCRIIYPVSGGWTMLPCICFRCNLCPAFLNTLFSSSRIVSFEEYGLWRVSSLVLWQRSENEGRPSTFDKKKSWKQIVNRPKELPESKRLSRAERVEKSLFLGQNLYGSPNLFRCPPLPICSNEKLDILLFQALKL